MAYELVKGDRLIVDNLSIIETALSTYSTLGDPNFDMDRDELLAERSALELVRDQLSLAQQAELDLVDQYWRDHAAQFNLDFARLHVRKGVKSELEGFVYGVSGDTPAIPRAHWWWWPIEAAEGGAA